MKIDITLVALLKHAKTEANENDWKSLAKTLAPIYNNEMRMLDVFSIVANAYLKARDEVRFHMAKGKHAAIIDLLLAPVKSHATFMEIIRPETVYTVEIFYNRILASMMSELMMTRIDWLTPDYSEELPQPSVAYINGITAASFIKADTFNFGSTNGVPVIKIMGTGEIFWNGKAVEGDDEFKKSMLELRDYLSELK